MLVNYVTFAVDTEDRAAFDSWYLRLVEAARQEDGCIVYDYLTDPSRPGRGITLAAWESEADLAAHRLHPSHIELMALGSTKWGMHDIKVHSWTEIGGYRTAERPRLDGPSEDNTGREAMHTLIKQYQEHADSGG
jgi:quinol monooxygenase YgiN